MGVLLLLTEWLRLSETKPPLTVEGLQGQLTFLDTSALKL